MSIEKLEEEAKEVWSFFDRYKKEQDDFRNSMIRLQIKELVARGNVTLDEYKALAMNSYERELILPALTNEALLYQTQYALDNCYTTQRRPVSTYNEAIEAYYTPELMKRLVKALTRIAELERDEDETRL